VSSEAWTPPRRRPTRLDVESWRARRLLMRRTFV
jgi:hypothetical protein